MCYCRLLKKDEKMDTCVNCLHMVAISLFSAAVKLRILRAGTPDQTYIKKSIKKSTSPLPTVLRGVTTEPGAIADPSQI